MMANNNQPPQQLPHMLPCQQTAANYRHNIYNELSQFVPPAHHEPMGVHEPTTERDQMWRDDVQQAGNIQRYGGPIRKVDFHGTDMSALMTGNQNQGAQLNWEPYRNEGFRGQQFQHKNQQQQRLTRERVQPFARQGQFW